MKLSSPNPPYGRRPGEGPNPQRAATRKRVKRRNKRLSCYQEWITLHSVNWSPGIIHSLEMTSQHSATECRDVSVFIPPKSLSTVPGTWYIFTGCSQLSFAKEIEEEKFRQIYQVIYWILLLIDGAAWWPQFLISQSCWHLLHIKMYSWLILYHHMP